MPTLHIMPDTGVKPGAEVSVRPFVQGDLVELLRWDSEARLLTGDVPTGGRALVLDKEQGVIGFTMALPLSGLEGHLEIYVAIHPSHRRQGYGSRLLEQFLSELQTGGVRIVSYGVNGLDIPAAHFLTRHGFYLEHVELEMERAHLEALPHLSLPVAYHLQTFSRGEAIRSFRQVYDQAFQRERSYQPYPTDDEVDSLLHQPEDLLFLMQHDAPVGFAWTRSQAQDLGEIEPIGIAEEYQGKGLGRLLLIAALQRLAKRGCKRVRLGVWSDNERAIRLYESLGFRRIDARYFLAFDLEQEAAAPGSPAR